MGQTVLQVNSALMEKMKNAYIKDADATLPPGSVFRAKRQDCTITGYRSGKVLFQGKSAEQEAQKWGGQKEGPSPASTSKKWKGSTSKKSVESHDFLPPNTIEELAIIGSDEVGTGDFFGPMTVAACYVSPAHYATLKKLGVRDSKNLTDTQISAIAKSLINEMAYSLLILPNEKYNQLREQGMTQIGMKALLHQQAQLKLRDKITEAPLDGYLVDQFATPDLYFKSLKEKRRPLDRPIYFKTKGESVHLSVAAASIIARYAFIKEMDKLSEECGMTLPKGAGAHVDEAGARLIKLKGEDYLSKVAKLHFSNADRARALAKR
ncbi:ribonuclease HIII [Pullulanibacillus sp. KACC 23026]|uniref:ribonuclease HIII n=1 Tax=Pullulanibacillus sp. KACC 23026 TaxID=3028315 RepID=UPI0023B0B22F|nr:ribonuclease HIII [Pullulanibacillus sp. KACC 23026]WEG13932.1 ribonuclease HIII [Pullulanibacillus sp. KACC 23026]